MRDEIIRKTNIAVATREEEWLDTQATRQAALPSLKQLSSSPAGLEQGEILGEEYPPSELDPLMWE